MFRTLVGGGRGVVRVAARGAAAGSGSARSMGGHARDVGLPGQHPPIPVSKVYQTLGTAYLTTMFLWMMYRAKEDGMVVLGFEHPWDHLHEDHVTFNFKEPDVVGDDDDEEEEEEEEEEE